MNVARERVMPRTDAWPLVVPLVEPIALDFRRRVSNMWIRH